MSPISEQPEEKKNTPSINYLIAIAPDQLTVFLTIIASSPDIEITAGDIESELKKKNVVFGIDNEAINKIVSGNLFNAEHEVAHGKEPQPSQNGELVPKIERGKRIRAGKGEVVLEYQPASAGIDGMMVTGKVIKTAPPKEAARPKNEFLGTVEGNENQYSVQETGYISIDNHDNIMFEPLFQCAVSKDEMDAALVAASPNEGEEITVEEVRAYLTEQNVTAGIIKENIEKVVNEKLYNQSIQVATGVPVTDGKDGYIKYYFDEKVKPHIDEQGNVDYKRLNLVQNVRAGDKLIELIAPADGKEGMTVTGKSIPPKPGKPAAMPPCSNAKTEQAVPAILKAEIDGRVVLKGKQISVEPVFTVGGDVDYETGNIDFLGSVVVKGDVKSGFNIKARDDIQIDGMVEDSTVEAQGSVMVKGGFVGRGHGRIFAGKDIWIKFCDNQILEAKSNIELSEYIMHSQVFCKGVVKVLQGKGLIVGGNILATNGVEAKIIGNQRNTATEITAGIDPELEEKMNGIIEKVASSQTDLKKVSKALQQIAESQSSKSGLPPEKMAVVEKLKNAQEQIQENDAALKKELEECRLRRKEFRTAIVKVYDAIYPGVLIDIQDNKYAVREQFKNIYFSLGEEGVLAQDMDRLQE